MTKVPEHKDSSGLWLFIAFVLLCGVLSCAFWLSVTIYLVTALSRVDGIGVLLPFTAAALGLSITLSCLRRGS